MASLQRDLADNPSQMAAAVSGDAGDCPIKLNRRSLGGLAFEIQLDDAEPSAKAAVDSPSRKVAHRSGGDNSSAGGQQQQQQPQLSAEEIAERLAAAELRREQQLAERVGKLESKLSRVNQVTERQRRDAEERAELSLKTVEETLKAAEERRLGRMEEVKQRARGQSAGAKERREAVREQQAAARQSLEAELEKDFKEKEARRKEKLEKIVQGAQQHLAKVEDVRNQRLSGAEILPDE